MRIELTTFSLATRCSTAELHPLHISREEAAYSRDMAACVNIFFLKKYNLSVSCMPFNQLHERCTK